MFGISIQEFLIIIIIGIIIIPAKEFPKVLRTILKASKKIQDFYSKLLREINLLDL